MLFFILGSDYQKLFIFNCLGFEPGVFKQLIAEQGKTQNTTELFRQFRWNLICGSYLAQRQ